MNPLLTCLCAHHVPGTCSNADRLIDRPLRLAWHRLRSVWNFFGYYRPGDSQQDLGTNFGSICNISAGRSVVKRATQFIIITNKYHVKSKRTGFGPTERKQFKHQCSDALSGSVGLLDSKRCKVVPKEVDGSSRCRVTESRSQKTSCIRYVSHRNQARQSLFPKSEDHLA